MDFLKALFDNGALTWEQFSQAVSDKGFKVADLSSGNYVSKRKFDDEIKQRETTINELNTQISTRDTDIQSLQTQLADGTKDNETKFADLTSQLSTLQGKYDTQRTEYENKINHMNYEYAVKDFANTKKFSSDAAKRDFVSQMLSANLTMQDKSIMGAEDFATKYQESNSDAFVVDTPPAPPEPDNKPTFIQPTPPQPEPDSNPFNFNFQGI